MAGEAAVFLNKSSRISGGFLKDLVERLSVALWFTCPSSSLSSSLLSQAFCPLYPAGHLRPPRTSKVRSLHWGQFVFEASPCSCPTLSPRAASQQARQSCPQPQRRPTVQLSVRLSGDFDMWHGTQWLTSWYFFISPSEVKVTLRDFGLPEGQATPLRAILVSLAWSVVSNFTQHVDLILQFRPYENGEYRSESPNTCQSRSLLWFPFASTFLSKR